MKKILFIAVLASMGCQKASVDIEKMDLIKNDGSMFNRDYVTMSVPDTGFTLAFEDNFNDSTLNLLEWAYRTGGKLDGFNRAQNVSIGGGKLNIALKEEVFSGYNYTCGGVYTKDTFKYGYYETSAILPSLPGWHSSFWSFGATVPAVNEIDCFEVDSHQPSNLYTNTHHYSPSVNHGSKVYTGVNTSTAYHTYGWEWTPSAVYFYVDNVLIRTVRYLEPHAYQNVFLTSLAYDMGAGIEGDTFASFDYFRYYAKNYPLEIFIDNNESGFTENGPGWIASGLKGWGESNTRATNQAGSYGQWTFNVETAGNYKVFIYKVIEVNSDPNAKIEINHNGTIDTIYLNYASGTSGWVDAGTYYFSGTSNYIRNTVSTTAKWGRYDAIKLVKQ